MRAFRVVILLNLDNALSIEQFEATASQSTVPSPPSKTKDKHLYHFSTNNTTTTTTNNNNDHDNTNNDTTTNSNDDNNNTTDRNDDTSNSEPRTSTSTIYFYHKSKGKHLYHYVYMFTIYTTHIRFTIYIWPRTSTSTTTSTASPRVTPTRTRGCSSRRYYITRYYMILCRFAEVQSSIVQFESLKSEQIHCGCSVDPMPDFNVPGSRPQKTRWNFGNRPYVTRYYIMLDYSIASCIVTYDIINYSRPSTRGRERPSRPGPSSSSPRRRRRRPSSAPPLLLPW